MLKKILPLAVLVGTFINVHPVMAADVVVMPQAGQPYGAHEVWAHSEMGQSFVAPSAKAKGGLYVQYDSLSAALGAPNAPTTQVIANLYDGEGLNSGKLLQSATFTIDTTTKGFLDVDYSAMGINLVPGNTYTLGLSSPNNRGWIVPSVCDYTSAQPTGAYTSGHPFFNGTIVLNETGICDNAFHVLDMTAPAVVTPAPASALAQTATSDQSEDSSKAKKVEGKGVITEVGASWIVVKGVTVQIDSQTVIKLNDNTSLAVGQKAEYKGTKNTDGSVSARKIEVK